MPYEPTQNEKFFRALKEKCERENGQGVGNIQCMLYDNLFSSSSKFKKLILKLYGLTKSFTVVTHTEMKCQVIPIHFQDRLDLPNNCIVTNNKLLTHNTLDNCFLSILENMTLKLHSYITCFVILL